MTAPDPAKKAMVLEHRAGLIESAKRARAAIRAHARQDPAAFMRYVLRDEQTGHRVQQAPMHDRWQQLLSTQDRVVLWSHVEAGKSSQVSIGRPLYELGKDPNRRVVVVMNTQKQARKVIKSIRQYIERSTDLKDVFPELQPARDRSLPWTSDALTVERDVISKDPSVQACGVHGNILGARIDDLILDDILDYENTRTPHARDDLYAWVKSTLFGRLTERARVWAVGNAYHPEDAMHRLAAEPRFFGYRFPVMGEDGEPTWPERWPKPRIESARLDMGPLEFARQLMCRARDDTTARFKREWIDVALRAGAGYRLVDSVDHVPDGFRVVHGVDLGAALHAKADLSVIFSLLLHPTGHRQVLAIQAGRWTGPDIVRRIEHTHRRFGGDFLVENNAAQVYLIQFAEELTTANVHAFATGRNKAHPEYGVESLAAEMAGGRWIIPSRDGKPLGDLDAWVAEMLYYEPGKHTGDRLMASWFAREGARRLEVFRRRDRGNGGAGVRIIGAEPEPEGGAPAEPEAAE